MIGEGDLDPSEGQSQPLVGTLPLTEKDPPEKPEDKDPPPSSSAEGLDTEVHEKKMSPQLPPHLEVQIRQKRPQLLP